MVAFSKFQSLLLVGLGCTASGKLQLTKLRMETESATGNDNDVIESQWLMPERVDGQPEQLKFSDVVRKDSLGDDLSSHSSKEVAGSSGSRSPSDVEGDVGTGRPLDLTHDGKQHMLDRASVGFWVTVPTSKSLQVETGMKTSMLDATMQ